MKRIILYAFVFVLTAGFTAAWRVLSLPHVLVSERNAIYIKQAGGYNRFVHTPLPDSSWREFVRPSPDLLYSYLVFDTEKAAVAVTFPGYVDYWVNQMVDDKTDSFAYTGNRQAGGSEARILVYSDKTPPFTPPPGFLSVKSPSATGTMLLRYLIRRPEDVAKIDALRRQVKVDLIDG